MTEKTEILAQVLDYFQPQHPSLTPTDHYLSGLFAGLAHDLLDGAAPNVLVQRTLVLHHLTMAHLEAARAGRPPPLLPAVLGELGAAVESLRALLEASPVFSETAVVDYLRRWAANMRGELAITPRDDNGKASLFTHVGIAEAQDLDLESGAAALEAAAEEIAAGSHQRKLT